MKVLITEKLSPNKFIDNSGYLICNEAVLARTGKQQYLKSEIFPGSNDDSIIEVDRKPEQVFSPQTLASFENKPLTVEHPDENVTPENYKSYAVGFVRDVKKGTYNGQDVILGTLVVTDADTIEDIQNGIRTELSCGYDCDITEEANPQQINIRGNHVALCEQGRAGIAKIIDTDKIHKRGENGMKDANDYNAYLTKLGFQWLKKMASDREKWYFTGSQEEFLNAVNTIRKDKENLIESSSNDGSKTITIVKPSSMRKDSIKDELMLTAGSKYVDKGNNTWLLKRIDGDNLYFDIKGKENILNKDTFVPMIGKEILPVRTMDSIARGIKDVDFTNKVVIYKDEDGKLACVSKADFDNGVYDDKVTLYTNDIEEATEYLIKECEVARENIIDATRTLSSIKDCCEEFPKTDYPKFVELTSRGIVIKQNEDCSYFAEVYGKEIKDDDLDKLKDKIEDAIFDHYEEYAKSFEKKELKEVDRTKLLKDEDTIQFSNHFYEEVEKILKRKLKKYEKGKEDSELEIKADDYKKMYEEAKNQVIKEIEKQLEEVSSKIDKENKDKK